MVEIGLFCEFVKCNGDIQIHPGWENSSFSLLSFSGTLIDGVLNNPGQYDLGTKCFIQVFWKFLGDVVQENQEEERRRDESHGIKGIREAARGMLAKQFW